MSKRQKQQQATKEYNIARGFEDVERTTRGKERPETTFESARDEAARLVNKVMPPRSKFSKTLGRYPTFFKLIGSSTQDECGTTSFSPGNIIQYFTFKLIDAQT